MYALVVKNDKGSWDVWNTLPTIPIPEKEVRLQAALKSGLPIIGKNVTQYKASVKNGSVWDGKNFVGGAMNKVINEDTPLAVYAYICDNTVVLLQFAELGTDFNKYLDAIFDSETTVINVPEGQVAKTGYVWDGLKMIEVDTKWKRKLLLQESFYTLK